MHEKTKRPKNADKTDICILIGKHTYTCYVSAILAYIPFGCLHYRSHYFVPNLCWTNLQSKQQRKKRDENWSNDASFARIAAQFMDWFWALNCPYCCRSDFFGRTFVLFFSFKFGSVVTEMFMSFFFGQLNTHWLPKFPELNHTIASNKQNRKITRVYQIDSPIRFHWNVNNNWSG